MNTSSQIYCTMDAHHVCRILSTEYSTSMRLILDYCMKDVMDDGCWTKKTDEERVRLDLITLSNCIIGCAHVTFLASTTDGGALHTAGVPVADNKQAEKAR